MRSCRWTVRMKRSLRLPFIFLIIVAVFSVFSFREALEDSWRRERPPEAAPSVNASLVLLAAAEDGDGELEKDVSDLLHGIFPSSARRRRRRDTEERLRESHIEMLRRTSTRFPKRLRAPKDYMVFPDFRRALRDWFRRRRFDPGVMPELLDLVKSPIDRHRGLSDRSGNGGRRYGSCAVVGNSGILLKSNHGELIDGHEFVIRLNNARVVGYGPRVGAKTDLSFINSNVLHLCSRRPGCYCHPYGESVPIAMYICQAVHFLDYAVCNSSHKAPLLITDLRFDALCSRVVKYYSLKRFTETTGTPAAEWGKAHDEKMFHYSSGMQAVMLALGICDRVSVFGFGKSPAAKHHYHTNQKAELDLHDYSAEYALYRDLVEQPQAIPFLTDSGFKLPPVVFYH